MGWQIKNFQKVLCARCLYKLLCQLVLVVHFLMKNRVTSHNSLNEVRLKGSRYLHTKVYLYMIWSKYNYLRICRGGEWRCLVLVLSIQEVQSWKIIDLDFFPCNKHILTNYFIKMINFIMIKFISQWQLRHVRKISWVVRGQEICIDWTSKQQIE